jgi:hypothetical protein
MGHRTVDAARVRTSKDAKARGASIDSLAPPSLSQALAYVDQAGGDEIAAAFALAIDRNILDDSLEMPDSADVHHALFMLRKARGLASPSFDLLCWQLKRRAA